MGDDSNCPFLRIKSRDGKDLPLFTGLRYSLSVKSIPNGVVTFESEPREEGNLIQLALSDVEDFFEGEDEGPLAPQASWTLIPEEGSSQNEYRIKVVSNPEAVLSYTHGVSWGGRYMELDFSHPENYIRGANMYSSSLWYFQPSESPDFFTIHNSDSRRDAKANYVTFSNEPSERGQLMQLGTKDLENYAPRGIFRNDALWQLKPRGVKLLGTVCNFVFEEPSEAELAEEAYPLTVMEQELSKMPFHFTATLPETFKLIFMQSFKPFPESSLRIDPSSFSGNDSLKFLKGKPEITFKRKYGSSTQFVFETETEYNFRQDLSIPNEDGDSCLRVKGFCNFVKDLEIPFTAIVKVTAEGSCFNSEDKGQPTVIPKEVIEYLLKYEKFTGKIKPASLSRSPSPVGIIMRPPEPIKVLGNTLTAGKGGDEGVVLCEVSGRLKCSCGLDTYIEVMKVH